MLKSTTLRPFTPTHPHTPKRVPRRLHRVPDVGLENRIVLGAVHKLGHLVRPATFFRQRRSVHGQLRQGGTGALGERRVGVQQEAATSKLEEEEADKDETDDDGDDKEGADEGEDENMPESKAGSSEVGDGPVMCTLPRL
ncbi:hypothetical protein MCOR34_011481 [Pyricularia oryzae]|nr:hypothetical protein MCOR26_011567 [Pyricularia oryzae]KAI6274565.1 hypothetical protein MCOR34_011481 [Pyricularia oryzae]KAI6441785.1 hypothetical protein MCOR17_011693 [Pyricularia oryzae]KAI6576628.1 hypothetical protein MCOR06_011060 [Pyricularia oryzae]